MSAFGCYKIVRDNIDDTDRNNNTGHRTDAKYHNLIGIGPGGVGVYELKNRLDFDMAVFFFLRGEIL